MSKAITPTREQLEAFIWDTYKEAHGFRPRFVDFASMSYDELEKFAIQCDKEAKEAYEAEQQAEKEALQKFEAEIFYLQTLGAGSREDAIRWKLQAEGLDREWDAGYICYSLGIGYEHQKMFEPFTNSLTDPRMVEA